MEMGTEALSIHALATLIALRRSSGQTIVETKGGLQYARAHLVSARAMMFPELSSEKFEAMLVELALNGFYLPGDKDLGLVKIP